MLLYKRKGLEYGIFRYAMLYSEIEDKLLALTREHPENVRFDVMGYSREGRKLFLVTVAGDVSESFIGGYKEGRARLINGPKRALEALEEKRICPPLPLLINCNIHGNEISGADGMLTFIDEVLKSPEKERYLNDCVLLISICLNPDGRCRGLDILNGCGVDLNRDWMAQTQSETRALISGCLKEYYPTILVDMHGYMSSGNIIIDGCTPPHNPLVEYDLLSSHIIGNSEAMAREIKRRTGLDTDIPALTMEYGWDDYSPVYTTGYFMCNGAVTHTIETNFPSEEGAYITHFAAVGMLDYVHENKTELYKNQCMFYHRGILNEKENEFHADFYIIKNERKPAVAKTVDQLIFNGVSVFVNANGDFVVPLSQPLRPLIHNMLWQGEDISDRTENCYDISFYSHSVMRGLTVYPVSGESEETAGLTPAKPQATEVVSPVESGKKKARILAVTESGAIDSVLAEAGYECSFLPFSELNAGWKIDSSSYDVLIVGGTRELMWEDAYDENQGVGYQNSWGLRDRGRREVIRAAKESKRLLLFGYADMKLNEAVNRVRVGQYIYDESNGSFEMLLDIADPLCAGYRHSEVFYLVSPVAFEDITGSSSARYSTGSFINGFNRNKGRMDGHIAAFHAEDGEYNTVMIGFDPVYRGYTDASFDILLNAAAILTAVREAR